MLGLFIKAVQAEYLSLEQNHCSVDKTQEQSRQLESVLMFDQLHNLPKIISCKLQFSFNSIYDCQFIYFITNPFISKHFKTDSIVLPNLFLYYGSVSGET